MIQSSYRFRIRFFLPAGDSFNFDEKQIEIQLDNFKFVLKPFNAEKINQTNHLLLIGGSFNTPDEAEKIGMRAKKALLLSSTKLRIGIDLGSDKATGGLSNYLKDKICKETGEKIINDVHGLSVYENIPQVKFIYAGPVTVGIGINDKKFTHIFSECYKKNLKLSATKQLALELYSASFFEPTLRARFLTLMMVTETLIKPNKRIGRGKEFVEHLIEKAKQSNLINSERQSILGSLQWLLKESISKTGRDLADKYLGEQKYLNKSSKQFFTYCYSIRSDLVHKGYAKDEKLNFGTLVGELQRYVADLLDRILQ